MKKMLMLGTSVGSVDIINYAKNKGVYTVVSDYYDPEKSRAKQFADDSIMISTSDVLKIEEYCKNNEIDAVFSGVSEFNIENAMKVSENLKLPFYCTGYQWQMFMNKKHFRELCNRYEIKTPYTYFVGDKNEFDRFDKTLIKIPVIVKPIDMRANIGISVCRSLTELDKACIIAFSASKSGEIIIEQYIDGPEVSCTYVIQDHKCKLVCMGTKYAYINEKGLKALSHAYIYPSSYLNQYMETVDENMQKMIISNQLNNCTIFFQGIYSDGSFYFFESGLRMEGTCTYKILELMNQQNFMHFMVDNALQFKTEYDIEKEDASFNGNICVYFSLICKEGKISKIEGLEAAKNNPIIASIEQRHYCGETIQNDGTLRQLMFRFILKTNDKDRIIDTIKSLQNTVCVYDENGEEMLIKSFNPSVLFG